MAATASPPTASQRWLWGPIPDLLFGSGALYLAFLVLLIATGSTLRQSIPVWVPALLVILVSMPHYGGTLVRVYETRTQRHAYWVFTVYSTLLVLAFFVTGLYVPIVGSLLLTLYLTWSPWHYSGQNYGIAVLFLRRAGVDLPESTKRLLNLSFILSYAIVVLTYHTVDGRAVAYNLELARGSVLFLPLGIPQAISQGLILLVAAAYLLTTGMAFRQLSTRATRQQITPTLVITLLQSLWFALPMAVEGIELRLGAEALDQQRAFPIYILWVAIAHAAQYLWVTSYYAKATPEWGSKTLYYGKVLAAGVAIWTLPLILFAPHALGSTSFDSGLALVLAAGVNVHHFILDGAIWKLRHTRIGNVLIRSQPNLAESVGGNSYARSWVRRGIWSVLTVSVPIALFAFHLNEVAIPEKMAAMDVEGVTTSLDRLAWTGRDDAQLRLRLARMAIQRGEPDRAIQLFERSLELNPKAEVFAELGTLHSNRGAFAKAVAVFEDGLALEPNNRGLLLQASRAEFALEQPDRALRRLELLVRLYPEDQIIRRELAHAVEKIR